jgi:hypothetical protein
MKLALQVALLLLAFTFPAKAYDVEYDTSAICDTQSQAKRLAMLFHDDEQTAIATVNAEAGNPSACAVETVAFVRGASPAVVRSKDDAIAVVEILVVGVDLGSGFSSVAPGAYFMLVKIDEAPRIAELR